MTEISPLNREPKDEDSDEEKPRRKETRAKSEAKKPKLEPKRTVVNEKAPETRVPESEEIRRHAEAEVARRTAQEAHQTEEERDRQRLEQNFPDRTASQTKSASETGQESPVEVDAESVKRIAGEELEAGEAEQEDFSSTVDTYLNQAAASGDLDWAEKTAVEEHDLTELQIEIDKILNDPEYQELTKEAESLLDTEDPTEQELNKIAGQVLAGQADIPDFVTEPDLNQTKVKNQSTGSQPSQPQSTTQSTDVSPTQSIPAPGPGNMPPIAGDGGGGGSGGFGGPDFSPGMPPAAVPTAEALSRGLSRAERAKWRRQALTTGLFAGILGYYFGKKRGRHQQETKMKPIQEKLAKENEDLRFQVHEGERRIRSLEIIKSEQEKALAEPPAQPEAPIPKPPVEEIPESSVEPGKVVAPVASAKASKNQVPNQVEPKPTETAPVQDSIAPKTLAEPDTRPNTTESVLTQSTQPETKPIQTPEASTPVSQAEPEASEANVNLSEVLVLAKEVTIDGGNLEQLYNDDEIDASGLKQVVAEYQHGGDPERVLTQERRLKRLRAHSPESESVPAVNYGTGNASLLEPAASSNPDHMLPADEQAEYPAETTQHLLPELDQATSAKKRRSNVVAAGIIAAGLATGILLAILIF